jgi:hypothetical protein
MAALLAGTAVACQGADDADDEAAPAEESAELVQRGALLGVWHHESAGEEGAKGRLTTLAFLHDDAFEITLEPAIPCGAACGRQTIHGSYLLRGSSVALTSDDARTGYAYYVGRFDVSVRSDKLSLRRDASEGRGRAERFAFTIDACEGLDETKCEAMGRRCSITRRETSFERCNSTSF